MSNPNHNGNPQDKTTQGSTEGASSMGFEIETQDLRPHLEGRMKSLDLAQINSSDGCDFLDILHYLELNPKQDQDLIEGLVDSDWTVIYGNPKAGKTMLALHVADALSSGTEQLWGLRLAQSSLRVAVVTTDPGAGFEAARNLKKMEAVGIAERRLKYWQAPQDVTDERSWLRILESLRKWRAQVVVVDNLLGIGGAEDFNSNAVAAQVLMRVRQISDGGMRVIVVAHAKKPGQYSQASMLGSVAFTATFRRIVEVQARAGGQVYLKLTGNSVAERQIVLCRDPESGLLAPDGGIAVPEKPVSRNRNAITTREVELAHEIVARKMSLTEAGDYVSRQNRAKNAKAGTLFVKRKLVGCKLLTQNDRGKAMTAGAKLPPV